MLIIASAVISMRIGVICSAGGSAFIEAAKLCPHVEFRVVTDRPCEAEAKCSQQGIPWTRIEEPARENFSQAAYRSLHKRDACDLIILLFSRIVTPPLVGSTRLVNIHPSLLPSFPGMGAVRKAHLAGVKYLGATMHAVDAGIDTGPILAQTCQPLPQGLTLEDFNHLAFLHKTSLFLLAVELHTLGHLCWTGSRAKVADGLAPGERINPALSNPLYIESLRRLQTRGPRFL